MRWANRSQFRFASPRSPFGVAGGAVLSVAFAVSAVLYAQSPKPASPRLLDAEKVFSDPIAKPDSEIAVFLEEANAGSAAAKRDLGLVYQHFFLYRQPDPELALQWFEAASVAGDARAPSYAGDFYLDKDIGAPDAATARFWYQKGYERSDARATIALANLSCEGKTAHDLNACGALLNTAIKFQKPTDPADVLTSLQNALYVLGTAYADGKVVRRSNTAAAAWFAKAASLHMVNATVAEAALYVRAGGFHQDLPRATALLDGITPPVPKGAYSKAQAEQNSVSEMYSEIGAAYASRKPPALAQAQAAYLMAAALGHAEPAIQLATRYANGDGMRRGGTPQNGIPQNLDAAYTLLMQLKGMSLRTGDAVSLRDAFGNLATKMQAASPQDARLKAVRAEAFRMLPPALEAMEAAGMAVAPPAQMTERYPNISAPDSVTTQQEFSVQVSLDSIAFDAGTQILSGQQDNGKLQITLPDGMTKMPITVDLIAPGMTYLDSYSNSSQLMLDSTQPSSTPAVFHLRAGAKPASGMIRATLSYNHNPLAQVSRSVSVVAGDVASTQPGNAPVVPQKQPAIPPLSEAVPSTNDAAPVDRAVTGPVLHASLVPHAITEAQPPIVTSMPPKPAMPPASQSAFKAPVVIDATGKSTDLVITETRTGDTLHYTFDSPGLALPVDADVENAPAVLAIIQQGFAMLESDALNLSQTGAFCAADRVKGSGGDKDPLCADAVQARSDAEAFGSKLYNEVAPQAFRDLYQVLTSNKIRLHSITVVSNSPTMPWELVLPQNGTVQFLGLTASIVRQTISNPQLAEPADNGFSDIAVVIPNYDSSAKNLPASAAELQDIQSAFPQAKSIEGDAGPVQDLVHNTPTSIIHYIGHGQIIAQPAGTPQGVAPQTLLTLEESSLSPETFAAYRAGGKPAHPFYFFNACNLGTSAAELNTVSGWGPTLMESGASGYLGALYTIGDTSASHFAKNFYTALKASFAEQRTNPMTMADIVTAARRQTYSEANDPTALAYVLYAKPFMKLVAVDH